MKISDELIDELFAADVYVFGVPMYNFGVPAGFKAYIDQIVRVGRTFVRNEGQPPFEGQLKGKRLFLAMSSGADYAVGTPFANYNFVVPYLKAIFGFLGVADVEFVAVTTNSGEEVLSRTEGEALKSIEQFVAAVS